MSLQSATFILFLLRWSCCSHGYVLDCEGDRPPASYSSRRYLPNLVTLTRYEGGRYKVDLRCQVRKHNIWISEHIFKDSKYLFDFFISNIRA